MKKQIDIQKIIITEAIETFFQPIVSMRRRAIVGLEALSRGLDPETGEIIPPSILFEQAKTAGLTVELDRLCRERALTVFKSLPGSETVFLSLNFKTSVIDEGVAGSGYLFEQVCRNRLNCGNIVIEIVESEVHNLNALANFIGSCKEHGFLLALDDFGAGYSNFDRVALIKPDIIKVDRSLISNSDHEYYKQEIVKSLTRLSHNLGAIVLAEGTEREEETILALELGADLFQGYYFAKPVPTKEVNLEYNRSLIRDTAVKFKQRVVERIQERENYYIQFGKIISRFVETLSGICPDCFEERLTELINEHGVLECGYILNKTGIQVSDTVFRCDHFSPRQSCIFTPASKGADQSLKEYYLSLQNGLSKYVTEPYLSAASGNACVTISTFFADINNSQYILCLDFRA